MAVTSGFFNSVAGDRRYDAVQMASIFDGIIQDGVYQSIGNAFAVTANNTLTINVGTGRAWFDHSWTKNDALLPILMSASEVVTNRWDTVVLETNFTDAKRANTIKVITGTPAASPSYPALIRNATVNQYPLAHIYRAANTTTITQGNITNMVGTTACPFVIGVLTAMSIDSLTAQWHAQWAAWFAAESGAGTNDMDVWIAQQQAEFDAWFAAITTVIETNTATQLANRLLTLETAWNELALTQTIYRGIESSSGAVITDSALAPITAKIVYQVAN